MTHGGNGTFNRDLFLVKKKQPTIKWMNTNVTRCKFNSFVFQNVLQLCFSKCFTTVFQMNENLFRPKLIFNCPSLVAIPLWSKTRDLTRQKYVKGNIYNVGCPGLIQLGDLVPVLWQKVPLRYKASKSLIFALTD